MLEEAAERLGCSIIQMETDQDHVHILLDYKPNMAISSIVRMLKQYSTYVMWKEEPTYLSQYYWKHKVLWSDGYFACSIGQVSSAIIERYIQNQG